MATEYVLDLYNGGFMRSSAAYSTRKEAMAQAQHWTNITYYTISKYINGEWLGQKEKHFVKAERKEKGC